MIYFILFIPYPLDTGRKLKIHKIFVQFSSTLYGGTFLHVTVICFKKYWHYLAACRKKIMAMKKVLLKILDQHLLSV